MRRHVLASAGSIGVLGTLVDFYSRFVAGATDKSLTFDDNRGLNKGGALCPSVAGFALVSFQQRSSR